MSKTPNTTLILQFQSALSVTERQDGCRGVRQGKSLCKDHRWRNSVPQGSVSLQPFSGHECSSFAHYTMLASSAGAHKIERVRQVFETEHALAILDAFPTREGHCLLLPKVCFSFLCIGVTSVGRIFDCGGSLCASSDVFQSHNLLAWCPHSKKPSSHVCSSWLSGRDG